MIPLIRRASKFLSNIAIISDGHSFTYEQLLEKSIRFSHCLLLDEGDLNERRVAFVVDPGINYSVVQWAIWCAGGVGVPLNPKAPLLSLEYILEDAGVDIMVVSPHYQNTLGSLGRKFNIRLITTEIICNSNNGLPDIDVNRRAMILYTSGTTGPPKGVVTTHANIEAQIKVLVKAWKWSSKDHTINVLPLHHVHGIVNIVGCALWSGAICEFADDYDPEKLMIRLSSKDISLFMAVPTIYFQLIRHWESLTSEQREKMSNGLKTMRLMVSGSAALPVSVLEKWCSISGHVLLERYGMTEIGMAISNPYEGERNPGHIGQPLPQVEVRLVDDNLKDVATNVQGEILVKGPGIFQEYWGNPNATKGAFTKDGWFKTGDIAINNAGSFKIIGRKSIDIIKSGGYKISALEIEEVLREYHFIQDCAVVGIPDEEWGEIVAAALEVIRPGLNEQNLNSWLSERIPDYKLPRLIKVLPELPRNAMGKVIKTSLKEMISPST